MARVTGILFRTEMASNSDPIQSSPPSSHCLIAIFTAIIVLQAFKAFSVAVPTSNCYVLDNSSHILDFTNWTGHSFEYSAAPDLVVQFCKDVETRSQMGYVDFGRFDKLSYFVAGSGQVDFVQVVHASAMSLMSRLAGPRVFKGFTVGFNPRTLEIVYDGMTQLGFEKPQLEFSLGTEQTRVVLYMTAIASLSTLVRKPIVKVFPDKGHEVRLSGSVASGKPPTTLSLTMLIMDWRCEKTRDTPCAVNVTIPVEGYEPIQFILTKMCEFRQDKEADTMRGWAIFGVLSCIFAVSSLVFCCGGFIYKTRVQRLHGTDALPGMTLVSACLETVSGGRQIYARAEDLNSAFASEASWEWLPLSTQGTMTQNDRKYGAI